MKDFIYFLSALVLACGITLSGFFIKDGLVNLRANDRNVEVKGLSERYVDADIAVWTISHGVSDIDLIKAREKLDANHQLIKKFLFINGIDSSEIKIGRLTVYESKKLKSRIDNVEEYENIFEIGQTINIKTKNVKIVEKAEQNTIDLIGQGVLLRDSSPRYIYTKLNDIKPDMIGEATRNAREAADKFAKDSGSNVGNILRASQGWFRILPSTGGQYGEEKVIEKKIRVITTIDFLLVE